VRVSRGLLGASGRVVFFSSPVSRVWCSVLSLGHHRTGANATFFKVERCVTTPAPPRVDIPNDPSCVLKEPRPSRSGRCQLGQRRTFHQGRRSKRKEGLGGDMQRWARCTCQWRCRGEGERNHDKGGTRDRSSRLRLRPSSAMRTSMAPLSPVGRAASRIEGVQR
jgi:hypothetical protein